MVMAKVPLTVRMARLVRCSTANGLEEMRRLAKPARGVVSPKPTGQLEHRRVVPSGPLQARVAHGWWVRWNLEAPHRAVTLPHPTMHLVFEPPRRAEVVGIPARRFERVVRGRGVVFGVKFRPGGFSGLALGSMRGFFDRRVPAEDVLGAGVTALERAVARATSMEACLDALETLLPCPALSEAAVTARDLVERLETDPSLVRVEQVASLAQMSVRRLERLFLQHVGVSPKWVLQRYRLHEAAARLELQETSLAELAAALGYADQAHFTRNFTRVVGQSPAAFRKQLNRPR
jgi:AraC-like DNA-binding protein